MTDSKHFEMPNVKAALDKALKISGKDNVIIVCGSLYILGDALKFINGESDK